MDDERERLFQPAAVLMAVAALLLTACRASPGSSLSNSEPVTLHVGLGQVATNGLRTLAQNQAIELLASLSDGGRPRPQLAKDWTISPDGLSLTINLRPGVTFHDGSPVTSRVVADSMREALPFFMGTAFEDVNDVSAVNDTQVVLRVKHRSPFLLDLLEVNVPKPGAALTGTGPFVVNGDANAPQELKANEHYYLGRPTIERIVVQTFPSVRTAWAEMLRGKLDMLWEVGVDALDSLETSTNVAIFTYARHYQYVVELNSAGDTFRSKEIRRALNQAIDRDALVRDVLRGHGTVSSGPVWPHNWALRRNSPALTFDPTAASKLIASASRGRSNELRFTCLVRRDDVSERLALVLQKQLAAVGVQMSIEETGMDRILEAVSTRRFDAALVEPISGPTLLRAYKIWHSGGSGFKFNSPSLDQALERLRYAASDEEAMNAVSDVQRAAIDDPPAIFLAWMERARAVSKRFIVPASEPGRDVLANLRLWKPSDDPRFTNRN